MSFKAFSTLNDIVWGPSPSPSVIEAGSPECREAVLHAAGDLEIGFWSVTPGRFRSRKVGIGEAMTFLQGAGTLHHADGTSTRLAPGVVVHLEPGWEGVWDVEETIVKNYTIYPA
jgi:uncharacterized protein